MLLCSNELFVDLGSHLHPKQRCIPGGRSRERAQLQNAARLEAASHAGEVIGYLLKVLRSEEEGTAYHLKAGIELLDRGLGKPQQQVDIE
jgi:hypothetical protein